MVVKPLVGVQITIARESSFHHGTDVTRPTSHILSLPLWRTRPSVIEAIGISSNLSAKRPLPVVCTRPRLMRQELEVWPLQELPVNDFVSRGQTTVVALNL